MTTSADHDGRTWDVATGEPLEVLRGHSSLVADATFQPRFVAVSSRPGRSNRRPLGRARAAACCCSCEGTRQLLTSASFSPDGTQILTSSLDHTVRLYDCEVCLPLEDLVAVAERRLDRMGRELTPDERQELGLPA